MQTATDILKRNKLDNTVWGKKITAAEKRGHFLDSDKDMAGHWTTCACGKNEKVQSMMRERALCANDAPSDKKLRDFGMKFFRLISGTRNEGRRGNKERIVEVARTIASIERRARFLIKKGAPLVP